jgi:hypothetical protein
VSYLQNSKFASAFWILKIRHPSHHLLRQGKDPFIADTMFFETQKTVSAFDKIICEAEKIFSVTDRIFSTTGKIFSEPGQLLSL